MPVTPTYPGVYIEEISSGVRTITPVATAITAFIGRARRGLQNEPVTIQGMADFERKFGGLQRDSLMSYALLHYFLNGGSEAIVVRVVPTDAVKATLDVNGLLLEAASAGVWGNGLRARVDHVTKEPDNPALFNLFVKDTGTQSAEEFRNLSVQRDDPRYFEEVLREQSFLVRFRENEDPPDERPDTHPPLAVDPLDDEAFPAQAEPIGLDGGPLTEANIQGQPAERTGIYALEKADLFNMLCLPPATADDPDIDPDTYTKALKYCRERRAMLLVDPPSTWTNPGQAVNNVDGFRSQLGGEIEWKNAALFFPRVGMGDELRENRTTTFVPCGAVAGVIAKTDLLRGVWKSPAGTEASLVGVREFVYKLTDKENGRLNPLGVNCLRNFPVYGNVVWGSRTLAGADRLASEWKYLAVRRFTLFLEESLYRGTQWVVFEPNDEPLWSQIRLNINAFLQQLFRQGAFQGKSPREAYFVKCDGETTTQQDIDQGIVNIEVGFAPLKPAEFVIIKIRQKTNQEGG